MYWLPCGVCHVVRITTRLLSARNNFFNGKRPFCLLLTVCDRSSLTNNGGPLPFRFLARDMTEKRRRGNLTMTVFSPMASIHGGEDGHGQVSFCVCSTSTFSFSIFALHLGISRTLNSQSSQVSDPSSGISKIRVFLRLWFSTLSILDSSFSTRASRCWWPHWRSW